MLIVISLIGITCFGLYVGLLARNVLWGWGSLLLVDWYSLTFGVDQSILGSFHVDPLDIVVSALLFAGIYRFYVRLRVDSGTAQTLILVFAGCFLFSLIRGVIIFDIKQVGNESRGLVWPLIGMLYFFTIPRDEKTIRQFVVFYIYCGAALFFTGIFAYAGFHVGGVAWAHLDTEISDERLLPSSASCQIALSAVLLLAWGSSRKSERWMFPLAAAFLAMAILVRTRTVWLVIIAIFSIAPFIDLKLFKKAIPLLMGASILTLLLGIAFYHDRAGLSEQLGESSSDSVTFEWRVLGWEELLSMKEQTPFTVIVGREIGSGFTRIDPDFGTYIEAPPHNEYIAEYLRIGVFGTFAGLLLILRPTYRLVRSRLGESKTIFPTASAWRLICVGLFVFGITYSINIDGWALIGVANALLFDRESKAAGVNIVTNGSECVQTAAIA